jgi:hypothetical protein
MSQSNWLAGESQLGLELPDYVEQLDFFLSTKWPAKKEEYPFIGMV